MAEDLSTVSALFRSYVVPEDNLHRIAGFPYAEYQALVAKYQEWESWFDGTALTEFTSQEGKSVEKYPVKINPIYGAALKHAYALYGEFQEDSRPLAPPKVDRDSAPSEAVALHAEQVLNDVWWENGGRAIQMENGIISQVYGGSIIKLSYVPWETWRRTPIRIERIHPMSFFGIPDGSDPWRLKEAWIVKAIAHKDALDLGIEIPEDETPLLTEYWNRKEYSWTISGRDVQIALGDQQFKFGGTNPWGHVPIVYIPHIRTGGFWGESSIPVVQGVVKELNLRVADIGDAVADDSHRYLGMRNVQGAPSVLRLGAGLPVINLGSNPAITGREGQPDIFEITKPQASEAMIKLVEMLRSQFMRDSATPAVAYGEDEGSQRSALTLHTRFWPLVAHVRMERVFADTGYNLVNQLLLKMLGTKQLSGITEEHMKVRMYTDWAPILPRDREAYVNELIARMTNNLGSPEKLLELVGDVEDVDAEIARIKEWLEFLAELEVKKAEAQAKAMADNRPQPASGKRPGSTTDSSAQAKK